MRSSIKRVILISLSTVFLSLITIKIAYCKNHVITASVTSFKPRIIQVELGDTISWKNMHGFMVTTEFMTPSGSQKYIPEGAKGWTSKKGENYTTSPFTIEGIYIYKSEPRWGAGMGGVIIVGNPANLEALKARKPTGSIRYLIEKAETSINQTNTQ